jgi:hypothetical protein
MSDKITPESFLASFAPFCVVLGVSLRESFGLPGQDIPPTDLLLARMELEMERLQRRAPEQVHDAPALLEILRRTLRNPTLQLLDPPEGPAH